MLGTGILKGMAVTARNFVGSYFEEDRLITVQYPEERNPLPENYRNFPFLVYDGNEAEAGMRCVACKICEKECPPQCIYITKSDDKKPDYMGKPQFYPKVFDIDISVCMSCQICVEVCPFDAIKMDKDFELSRRDRFHDLLMDKIELAKSNEYYHRIHPVEAAEVDARLAEAAAKKKPAPAPTPAGASAGPPPASSTTPPKPGPTAPPSAKPPAPKPPATTPLPQDAQKSSVDPGGAVPMKSADTTASVQPSPNLPPASSPTPAPPSKTPSPAPPTASPADSNETTSTPKTDKPAPTEPPKAG